MAEQLNLRTGEKLSHVLRRNLIPYVDENGVDMGSFGPLLEVVAGHQKSPTAETNIEVWKLTVQLVCLYYPTRTPPSSHQSLLGTPRKSNSGSHQGKEEEGKKYKVR